MSSICPDCGSAELEKDAARGDTVCTSCGLVLEQNAIVSEVQFQETGAGGHSLIGKYVGADMPNKISISGMPGLDSRVSREITLQNGRRRIQEVASQLRLNQHCIDTAFNFFKMAVARGLTRGRRSMHVVAACLYITCRLEGTSHFLLDFSDVLQVNVFELGKVFHFLARALFITLPLTDPCVYILRFAHALEFGDKEQDVANVAMRLVQRMKRDWIAIGRRPTGLCGAALILAARFHNFNRTIVDVMRVVNIGESVLRKRLYEFGKTPTSALSLDDFQTVDLEEECDPPAFSESRLKAKEKQKEMEYEKLEALEPDLLNVEKEIDKMIDEKLSSKRKRHCSLPSGNNVSSMDTVFFSPKALRAEDLNLDEDEELSQSQEFLTQETFRNIIQDGADQPVCSASTPADKFKTFRPTLESLGIKKDTSSADDQLKKIEVVEGDETLDFHDIDDDEIDGYLLRSDEIEIRKRLWDLNNEPYLREMEEKRLKREEHAKQLEAQGVAPKKRRSRPKRKNIQAATVGEAIEKIVQEKKLSSKINYEVLKNLNESFDSYNTFSTSNANDKASSSSNLNSAANETLLSKPSGSGISSTSNVLVGVRKKPRPNIFQPKNPKLDAT